MTGRQSRVLVLSAGLFFSAVGTALGGMQIDGPPGPRPQAAPFPIVTQLADLSGPDQLERVQALSATDPTARIVAAVMLKPSLVETRRTELEAKFGAEQTAALAALAVELHVEARGDARVRAGLGALARKVAPNGLAETLDVGRWFDGEAAKAAVAGGDGPVVLTPARAWPLTENLRDEGRVHTLTSQGGQLLINGKSADRFGEMKSGGGVTKETLIHPDAPRLLVRIYHSPASMAGYERKAAKIERLRPLAAAGAAPKVLEHGEAPIQGKGMMYFYVQELAEGLKLESMTPESRPLEAVRELFGRLEKAGLALSVPGPDPAWLLSHILVGKAAGGGVRAYLLDGATERKSPEDLKAHYRMLLAMLSLKAESGKGGEAARLEEYVEPKAERLEELELEGGVNDLEVTSAGKEGVEEILKRHGLDGAPGETAGARKTLRLEGEPAAVKAAFELLEDAEVAQVRVHRKVKREIERQGAKDFIGLLKLLPASAKRDALIQKIPGSVYAKTEGRDVAAILALIGTDVEREHAGQQYGKVPDEAWRRMSLEDVAGLLKQWQGVKYDRTAAAIARLWVRRRERSSGARGDLLKLVASLPEANRMEVVSELWPDVYKGASGKDLTAALRLLPAGEKKDELIRSIPGTTYAEAESGVVEDILVGLRNNNEDSPEYEKIPVEAWRRMERKDAELLSVKWLKIGSDKTAGAIIRLWMKAHHRGLPSGREAARKDLLSLLKPMPEANQADIAARLWPIVYQGGTGKELVEGLGLLPAGEKKDELILKIPGSAYAEMESGTIEDILVGMRNEDIDAPQYMKVPVEAWKKMERKEAALLSGKWLGVKNGKTAEAVARLWMSAHHQGLPGGREAARNDLRDMVKALPEASQTNVAARLWPLIYQGAPVEELLQGLRLLPEGEQRNKVIAEIPGAAYAGMEGKDVAAVLELLSQPQVMETHQKIPAEAWRRLSAQDVEGLVKRRLALEHHNTAFTIVQRWLESSSDHPRERGMTGDGLSGILKSWSDKDVRDKLILLVPEPVYAAMDSGEVAAVLSLLNGGYEKVPVAAWKNLSGADMAGLMKPRVTADGAQLRAMMKLWLDAHEMDPRRAEIKGEDVDEMLRLLIPSSSDLSEIAMKIPQQAYAGMSGRTIAQLFLLAPHSYAWLPEEAWLKIRWMDADWLSEKILSVPGHRLAGNVHRFWLNAHGGASGGEGKDLRAVLEALPKSAERDELILKIPAGAYVLMRSADIAAILALLDDTEAEKARASYARIPEAAWYRLSRPDMETLLARWTSDAVTGGVIARLWMGARQ